MNSLNYKPSKESLMTQNLYATTTNDNRGKLPPQTFTPVSQKPQEYIMEKCYTLYRIIGIKCGCTTEYPERCYEQGFVDGEFESLDTWPLEVGDVFAGDREWEWADAYGHLRGLHYAIAKANRAKATLLGTTGFQTGKAIRSRWSALSDEERSLWGIHQYSKLSSSQKREFHKSGALGRLIGLSSEDISQFYSDLGKKSWEGVSPEERSKKMSSIQTPEHRAKVSKNFWAGMTPEQISKSQSDRAKHANHAAGANALIKSGKAGTQQKVACPWCNTITSKSLAGRWHFNNCFLLKIFAENNAACE
jgi:hypothetical protein